MSRFDQDREDIIRVLYSILGYARLGYEIGTGDPMREVLLLLLALSFGGVPAARQETLLVKDVRNGVVTMTDGTNEYQMPEHEAWRVGDRAECIMLTRGTASKEDDEIAHAIYVWRK